MKDLSALDKNIYEWQLDVPGFEEKGQKILRNSTALISRTGGLGGPLAFELAAAGFGKIILAHGGNLKHSDLNRQILMRYEDLGQSRVESAKKTLNAFNPNIELELIPSNINEENGSELVKKADIVFDCAPLFEERFIMNRECVVQKKPLVDCAMYNMEGQVFNYIPGKSACLQCVIPKKPEVWKRKFPVLGSLSAMVACIGALEGIKILTGMAKPLTNEMLYINAMNLSFQKIPVQKKINCPICSGALL